MTTTVEEPQLQEVLDTPEDEGQQDSDGPALLVSFMDGSLEVVELAGTVDEDLDVDELLERFDSCEKKGATFVRFGRRRLRISVIRSIGPEDECDYPEVSAFGSMEERSEKLQKAVEQAANSLSQSAQMTAYLTQHQAAMNQAQANLFSAIEAEESLDEDPPQAPSSRRPKASPPGALKPLRMTPPGAPAQ